MTYFQAALTVLTQATRPLTVGEITSVALAHGLIHPRGQTPDRSMSSVLYRRMAADLDAPLLCRGGRFWLRDRQMPESDRTQWEQRRRQVRTARRRPRVTATSARPRRIIDLPTPPLQLTTEVLEDRSLAQSTFAPAQRERALARAGQRGARLLARLQERRRQGEVWDNARTDRLLIAPLLAHLGYRSEMLSRSTAARSIVSYTMWANSQPTITLEVRRLGHDLTADDVWHALTQAQQVGARFAAVTNGSVVRLYAVALADAHDDDAAALVVILDLEGGQDAPISDEQASAFWLLSQKAVAAGALDAYAVDRVVGATLLEAFDAPEAPLARTLVAAVQAQVGLAVPAAVILRHARLVVRTMRGREGEAQPEDRAMVAAVGSPQVHLSRPEFSRTA